MAGSPQLQHNSFTGVGESLAVPSSPTPRPLFPKAPPPKPPYFVAAPDLTGFSTGPTWPAAACDTVQSADPACDWGLEGIGQTVDLREEPPLPSWLEEVWDPKFQRFCVTVRIDSATTALDSMQDCSSMLEQTSDPGSLLAGVSGDYWDNVPVHFKATIGPFPDHDDDRQPYYNPSFLQEGPSMLDMFAGEKPVFGKGMWPVEPGKENTITTAEPSNLCSAYPSCVQDDWKPVFATP